MPMFCPTAPKLALCAALWFAAPAGVWATPVAGLETLFYTPAERQSLSLRRSGKDGAAPVATVRLTGVVSRAGGKGTVWINGEPRREGSPIVGTIKGVDAVVDGRRLRVGQGIDTTTGVRVDIVAPGAVTTGGKR